MYRFFHFGQWLILPKIMAISVISLSLITTIIIFYFSPNIEQRMLEEKKAGLKNVVDIAFVIFNDYETLVKSGLMTREEAQNRAILKVKNLRYSGNEYFWIDRKSTRLNSSHLVI